MIRKKHLLSAVFLIQAVLFAETVDFQDAMLRSRSKKPAAARLDHEVKVGQTPSVRLENDGKIFKTLELEPNTRYVLSFYVKGENIASGKNEKGELCGARITVDDGKRFLRATTQPRNQPETGTFDWRKGEFEFGSAEFHAAKVRIGLRLHGDGTVWYGEIKIDKKSGSAEETVRSFRTPCGTKIKHCALIPGGVMGFFDPGEQLSFQLTTDNTQPDWEYTVSIKDENGTTVFQAPRRKLEKRFTAPGQDCGYYTVTADIFSGAEKLYTIQSAFAVNQAPKQRDPFFQFGSGVDSKIYDGLKRVGGGTISMRIALWTMDRQPEKLWEFYRKRYGRFLDSGEFELVFCTGATLRRKLMKPEDSEDGFPILSDTLLQRLRNFVRYVAEVNKGKIRAWAIQQEIPSTSHHRDKACTWTEAMANQLLIARVVSRQVKKVDPQNKVFVGGCNMQEKLDIEKIVMSDLKDEFDEFVIDGYCGNWNMRLGRYFLPETSLMSFYREASALAASLGKNPLVRNYETGYNIHYGAPFDRGLAVEQAQLTARMMIISKAAPVSVFEIFRPTELIAKDLKDSDDSMHTIWKPVRVGKDVHFVPMPGGAAYAAAAAELAFAKVEREVTAGSLYSYVFSKPDGTALITLWDIEKPRSLTVELPAAADTVSMYGRKGKLAAGNQKLAVGPAPLYLTMKIPPRTAADWAEKSLQTNMPPFRGGGYLTAPGRARVFVKNLERESCRGRVITANGEVPLVIPPEQTASVDIAVTDHLSCRFQDEKNRTCRIELDKPDLSVHLVQKISAKPRFDGSGAWLRGLRSGTLQYPDHILPVSALQPEKCYFRSATHNPDGHNVSARYFTGYDDENFYLAVEVDDPVHIQNQSALQLWKDDSLQFVFAMAEPVPPEVLDKTEKTAASEFNFGLGLTPHGPLLVKYKGKNAGLQSHPALVTRKNGKTLYEAAVPFQTLGGRPKRFGFAVFDKNDIALPTAPYRLAFTPELNDDSRLTRLQFQ